MNNVDVRGEWPRCGIDAPRRRPLDNWWRVRSERDFTKCQKRIAEVVLWVGAYFNLAARFCLFCFFVATDDPAAFVDLGCMVVYISAEAWPHVGENGTLRSVRGRNGEACVERVTEPPCL